MAFAVAAVAIDVAVAAVVVAVAVRVTVVSVAVAVAAAFGFERARVSSELTVLAAAVGARFNCKQLLYERIPCKLSCEREGIMFFCYYSCVLVGGNLRKSE